MEPLWSVDDVSVSSVSRLPPCISGATAVLRRARLVLVGISATTPPTCVPQAAWAVALRCSNPAAAQTPSRGTDGIHA
jgi:hypothetical protein